MSKIRHSVFFETVGGSPDKFLNEISKTCNSFYLRNSQAPEIRDSMSVQGSPKRSKTDESYGIRRLITEKVYERQRINEFDVMEDEYTVFHRADSFETVKDGLIADFASALLNGRSKGRT